jgi:hypothetical protein
MTLQIVGSVGKGGANRLDDVKTVQVLLNANLGRLMPLQRLPEDGRSTPALIGAIEEFQRRVAKFHVADGRVDPHGRTLAALNANAAPGPLNGAADLETSLGLLKNEFANFGGRFIQDGAVRQGYMRQTAELANAMREEVRSGRLTPAQAAEEANKIRNAILDASRIKSSDIGRAVAEAEKWTGKTLRELEAKYARKLYQRPFSTLSQMEKNKVWLEIVESSGRSRPKINLQAARWSKLGRGLVFVSAGIAVHNVLTAEEPMRQAAKESTTLGVGIAGGALAGALAPHNLLCGPAAPVCVGVSVFVGGALAAFGADLAFDWLVP